MIYDAEARIRKALAQYPEGMSTAAVASITGANSKLRCEQTLLRMRDVTIGRWVDASTPMWMLAEIPADCPRPDGTLMTRTHGLQGAR